LFNPFPANVSLFASSMVLLAMGCVALLFSYVLARKSRALERLSKNLSIEVFSKTFNVFDPNIERRRIIGSHTGLVVFAAIYGAWFVVTMGVVGALAAGAVLASVIFVVCAALLMVDETQELNRNAGIFAKAIRGGAGLGVGDMQALCIMRATLPRLRSYHLVLGAVFFASAFAVSLLSDVILLGCADVAWVFFALSSMPITVYLLSIVAAAGLFCVAIVAIEIGVNEAKKVLFGFPRSIRIDLLDGQFERMRFFLQYPWTPREPLPEETENINRKELEEHSGS
jgi:hypothetical protein